MKDSTILKTTVILQPTQRRASLVVRHRISPCSVTHFFYLRNVFLTSFVSDQGSGFSCRFGPFLLLRCVIFSMAVFCTHFVHLSEKCKWYGNYNILNIRYLGFHKNVKKIYPGLLNDVIACRVPQGRIGMVVASLLDLKIRASFWAMALHLHEVYG